MTKKKSYMSYYPEVKNLVAIEKIKEQKQEKLKEEEKIRETQTVVVNFSV